MSGSARTIRRRRSPTRALVPAIVALLVLSACGDDGDSAGSALPPGTPAAPETSVPATAGPLSGRQMPDPAVLGEGWTERADPGAGHGDAHGDDHGAPDAPSTQQRDVDELMDGLTPIGCPEAAVAISLPRPRYALERTYAGPAGAPGVALVLEFADTAGPRSFLDRFERQMRACPAGAADADGSIALEYRSVARAPERVSGLRQEIGHDADPNRYLVVAVRAGRRIGLVYLSGVPTARAAAIGSDLAASIRHT